MPPLPLAITISDADRWQLVAALQGMAAIKLDANRPSSAIEYLRLATLLSPRSATLVVHTSHLPDEPTPIPSSTSSGISARDFDAALHSDQPIRMYG